MADKTLIHLRDYQQEIVARVHQEWSQHRSVMVQMPTGTGKTYVLAEVVEAFRSVGVQECRSVDDIRSSGDYSLRSAGVLEFRSSDNSFAGRSVDDIRSAGVQECRSVDNTFDYRSADEVFSCIVSSFSPSVGADRCVCPNRDSSHNEGQTHRSASTVAEFRTRTILIVAHRRELIEQIKETIGKLHINDESIKIEVESIQTISRRIDSLDFTPDLVIIDEAHHALAKTYRILWDKWPKAKFLGLTATPCRMNRAGFTELFDSLVTSWSMAEFVRKGVLSLFDYVSIRPNSMEQRLIDSLEKRGADGDYQIKEMDTVLNRRPTIERLYRSFKQFASGKKGIVYAISIDHARKIAAYYNQQGVKSVAIDSHTPREERKRMVEEFKEGRIEVLVNVDVFSEGFDCPDVEFVQMARPTLSLSKYLQQVGRGLRQSEGKVCCMLIDNVGLYRVFGLPVQAWDWEGMFRGEMAGKGRRFFRSADDNIRSAGVQECRSSDNTYDYRSVGDYSLRSSGVQEFGSSDNSFAGRSADDIRSVGVQEFRKEQMPAVGAGSARPEMGNTNIHSGRQTLPLRWADESSLTTNSPTHQFSNLPTIGSTVQPANALTNQCLNETDWGVGMVISHETLLEKLNELDIPPTIEERCAELKCWQEDETGLWGLKRNRRVLTKAEYVTVFDIKEGMAAVRFQDYTCGVVNETGNVLWKQDKYLSMRFARNRFVVVTSTGGKEGYVDLYNFCLYHEKPEIKRWGDFELLEVKGSYRSRTLTPCCIGIEDSYIFDKGYYLKISRPGRESICLLEGEHTDYYLFHRCLADRSIIVSDKEKNYYHVNPNRTKELIGHNRSTEEGKACRKEIDRLSEEAQAKRIRKSEEKKRTLFEKHHYTEPFQSGIKWGLKMDGRIIVPPIYRHVMPPVGNYCAVEMNYSQWGIIAIDGTILVEPKYREVVINEDHTALLTLVTGKKRVIKLNIQ